VPTIEVADLIYLEHASTVSQEIIEIHSALFS